MILSTSYILYFLILVSLLVNVNGYGPKYYPRHLVSKDEYPDKTVYNFPYCHSRFCKVQLYKNSRLNIIGRYPYLLDMNIKIKEDIDKRKIHLKNHDHGMLILMGKKPDEKFEKPEIKQPINPIYPEDKDIEVIDIDSAEEIIHKDDNAVSGYYNFQNQWINY